MVGLTDLIHGWSVWRDLRLVCLDLRLVCLDGFAVSLAVCLRGLVARLDLRLGWLSGFTVDLSG